VKIVVEFCRLPNGAIPEVLDEYLGRVAVTGITVYGLLVFFLYYYVCKLEYLCLCLNKTNILDLKNALKNCSLAMHVRGIYARKFY